MNFVKNFFMKKDELQKKYSLLKKQIQEMGVICTGSVISVRKKCGNPICRCHKDENALHGPYNIWTRKVKAKTVTRTLSDKQAQFCRECIQNLRKLEIILEEMKELSVQYVESYRTESSKEKNSE